MTIPPPSAPENRAVARSVPPISRLSYFDVLLGVLRGRPARLDELRTAIGLHIEDLAARGDARRTRDWRSPLAYRDPVVSCIRELIRWRSIEPIQLADDAAGYERIRNSVISLTEEGRRLAEMTSAERRDQVGQRLHTTYTLFRDCLAILSRYDIHVIELSDVQVRRCFPEYQRAIEEHAGPERVADACDEFLRWQSTPEVTNVNRGPMPSRDAIISGVRSSLEKRLEHRVPKNLREVTGLVNKTLAAVFLRALGFAGEWNSFDRCLRWGRDLYVTNDGRHIHGVPGWIAWAAATVEQDGGSPRFSRRGVSRHRDEVKRALVNAYRRIAKDRRNSVVRVPLLPIYEVRETAALACHVTDEVVDRVLGDLAFRRDTIEGITVGLQLADLNASAPSARPFYYEDKRYFYVTMQEDPRAAASMEDRDDHR
jgi:hypothetical protein